MLAQALPDDAAVASWAAGRKLERRTEHSLGSVKALAAELALVRQRGYATDDQENDPGIVCVAVPVFVNSPTVAERWRQCLCACLSLAAVRTRTTAARRSVGCWAPSPTDHPAVVDGHVPRLGEHMRLMRIGDVGQEKPAVHVDDQHYVDVSDVVARFDEPFFAGGVERLRDVVAARVEAGQVNALDGQRVGAPLERPHQILCIGLNYADHAAETGQAVPDEPILFTKSPNTLVGPNDPVRQPRGSTKLDWEVELGIVIGRRASYLADAAEARDAIAGWVVCNDVSERSFQIERGGQWSKGKSAETFNPAGPWLVTPDEIPDVLALDMWLDVNGVRRQTGNTRTMVFDPYEIVRYLSQFLVLEPGDLINTGTPPGVGMGFDPQVWLQPGDVIELGIEGLGSQRQTVLAPR